MAVDREASVGAEDSAPMLLTVKDLEAELQLGRTGAYELVRSGQIPTMRIGRAVRIPRDALRRWVDAQTSGADGGVVALGG
jgi:excisionase family DNA binding protein